MKSQASGIRHQAAGNRQQDALQQLLRGAVPAVDEDVVPVRDLWPLVRRRIELGEAEGERSAAVAVPWYDWALAAGVLAVVVVSPVSLPVLLYYL
jgi:hypothetical protein